MPGLRDTTDQEQEVLEWLNDRREIGIINMFLIIKDIERKYKVSNDESKRLLALWVRNFNDSGSYNDVIN